jgi:16S rRNA (cytidine1402-2'-O)-methyltransferase
MPNKLEPPILLAYPGVALWQLLLFFMAGILYLIPTVLAQDTAQQVLSPQVKEVLANTRHFFVENVRTTRRLISELKLGISIDSLQFYELNKDTPESQVKAYLQVLKEGADVGLLSEAGSPGIADPGALAVRLAHQEGIRVMPLAGPSAILMALMASGMNGQSFAFHGYLPIGKGERIKSIQKLEQEALRKKQTQLFMETPFRNTQLLEDLLQHCQPSTLLCIASALTTPEELVKTLPIKDWRSQHPDLHKKPTVFLIFAPNL